MTTINRLDIGDVIAATGLPASTLHLWERHGLLASCGRIGLRRQYEADVLDTIAIVLVCQRAGFTLSEIRELLDPDAFANDKGLLADKLEALKAQRATLNQAIDGLEHALQCDHEATIECPGFRAHLDGVLPVDRRRTRG